MTNYNTTPATSAELDRIISNVADVEYRLGLVASATDCEVAGLDPRFSLEARGIEEGAIRAQHGAEAEKLKDSVQHFFGIVQAQRELQAPALRRARARAAAADDPVKDLASLTLSARLAHTSPDKLIEWAEQAAKQASDELAALVLEEAESRGDGLRAEILERIRALADGIENPEPVLAKLDQLETLVGRVRELVERIQGGAR